MAPKGKGAAGAGKQSALTSTFGPVFKKIELKDLASHKDNSFTVLGARTGVINARRTTKPLRTLRA